MDIKKAGIGGVIALVVLGKFALKFGLGLGLGYGVTETEVLASKNDAWSQEYKSSFISGCKGDKETEAYQIFCSCMADKIENAHIIPTKYNSIKENENEYGDRMQKLIETHMATPEGKGMSEGCLKLAQGTLPADQPVQTAAAPSAAPVPAGEAKTN